MWVWNSNLSRAHEEALPFRSTHMARRVIERKFNPSAGDAKK